MTRIKTERRRRGRVPLRFLVTIMVEGREVPAKSRNISLKGLACSPHPLLSENVGCQVIIQLSPTIRAVIKGRVVRVDEDEAAIDFEAMDPDSFIHLKRLVEYHARQPEAISQELLSPAFPLFEPRKPAKKFVKKKLH